MRRSSGMGFQVVDGGCRAARVGHCNRYAGYVQKSGLPGIVLPQGTRPTKARGVS